jgi:IS6 family transposase
VAGGNPPRLPLDCLGDSADHGRFKARLRPMRGLKRLRSVGAIRAGHAFVHNLRRGHYELGVDAELGHRLSVAFAELALAI